MELGILFISTLCNQIFAERDVFAYLIIYLLLLCISTFAYFKTRPFVEEERWKLPVRVYTFFCTACYAITNYLSSNLVLDPDKEFTRLLLQFMSTTTMILSLILFIILVVCYIKTLIDSAKVGKKKNLILILNSPNNPSGAVCNNLSDLAKIAKKYKLLILSDEIYTDLSFDNRYHSISTFYPELTFISGGLSKWCGAGGWRLGFLAVPKKLNKFLSSLKSLASESYSTVNTPTQFAAVEAYEGDYSDYKLKVRGILNAVGNYVYNNLKSNKIIINPPQGAFYLMPEFKNSKYKSSAKLCEAILKDTGVAMLPGSDFGFKPKKMLTRLSYTDFDGKEFFRNVTNYNSISEEMVKRYAPNVVEGVSKLSNWAKNL